MKKLIFCLFLLIFVGCSTQPPVKSNSNEISCISIKKPSGEKFQLTSDMRIPAVLDSQILVSNKGEDQVVQVKILDDIYEPLSQRLVIPKNSIAKGTVQNFNPDTGVVNFKFDKVIVEGNVLPVNLQVGSADGEIGLKGQVRDTRGKLLRGSFISSFSSNAINWFSQEIIRKFLNNQADTGNSLTPAESESMTQIAELYASDSPSTEKIFWVPKGIPAVLFPVN